LDRDPDPDPKPVTGFRDLRCWVRICGSGVLVQDIFWPALLLEEMGVSGTRGWTGFR